MLVNDAGKIFQLGGEIIKSSFKIVAKNIKNPIIKLHSANDIKNKKMIHLQ
jgi:hypothetical protein